VRRTAIYGTTIAAGDSIYGLSLWLAADARRLDVAPARFSWIAIRASLAFLTAIGIDALLAHALECADASVRADRLRLAYHVNNAVAERERFGALRPGHVAN